MNALTMLTAVRSALVDEESGVTAPVFIAGAVPANQTLPYLVLTVLPSSISRVGVGTDRSTDGVQIDSYAATLVDAAGTADAVDAVVLSLGTVATEQDASLGFRRADGSWRTVFPTETRTSGERVARVALLYTQTDYRSI